MRFFLFRRRKKPIKITNDYVVKYEEEPEPELPPDISIKPIVIAEEDEKPHAYKAVEWND